MCDLTVLSSSLMPMTRTDLEHDGPPIRIRELVRLTGFTRHKLYADIRRDELNVVAFKAGSHYYWHVERAEALRYLNAIGYRWPHAC